MYKHKCSMTSKFKFILIDVKYLIVRFFTNIGVLSILQGFKNMFIKEINNI